MKIFPGRKLTLLVVGLTSMLLYNYYTSSVVSWLLNAAAPSIDSLDCLMSSDLELVFEDIGYTRGWLDVRLLIIYTIQIISEIGHMSPKPLHLEPYSWAHEIIFVTVPMMTF